MNPTKHTNTFQIAETVIISGGRDSNYRILTGELNFEILFSTDFLLCLTQLLATTWINTILPTPCMHLLLLFHHTNPEPGRRSRRTHSTYFLPIHFSPTSHQHFLPTDLAGKQTVVIFKLKIQDDQVGRQCDTYCVRLKTFENASPYTYVCLCTL